MRSGEELTALFAEILSRETLNKAVFSRPRDRETKKAVARLYRREETLFCQIERFTADNKAFHENLPLAAAPARLAELARTAFAQTDLDTTEGFCGILVSRKGQVHITDKRRKEREPKRAEAVEHNREKKYLLDPVRHAGFLAPLGVCDEKGRVFDKKRSKFRQINRFLELLDDVYSELPAEGTLVVCDLCCGKSYLTFAVYYYLTAIRKRDIRMYGVDRKRDVIDSCAALAERLGCEGLTFFCQDIDDFQPEERVDMVVSLHACDIATDIVLDFAIGRRAGVILSTPCCHHEMMGQIHCAPLSFITSHSMLKQKLCDAATDALRTLKLEAAGYAVDVLELIDAEETPKNVMLRAHRLRRADPVRCRLARTRYREAAAFLGVSPYRGLGGEEAEPRSGEESPSPVERLREVDFRPADEKRE